MLHFHMNQGPELVPQNGEKLSTSVSKDCDIHSLDINGSQLEGAITCYKTADNFSFIALDLQIHAPTEIRLKCSEGFEDGLFLFYNSKGTCGLKCESTGKRSDLSADNLYISIPKVEVKYSLFFVENQKVNLVFIQSNFTALVEENFCKKETLPEKINNACVGLYADMIQKKPLSSQMLLLINKCITNQQYGLERKMNLEAHCKELTALAIGTIGRYKSSYSNSQSAISSKEREAIHKAAQILEEKFVNPPLQGELAKMVGLNVNKLTINFKLVYGLTVNKYLLNLRMQKAKSLLTDTEDLKVYDVAEAVGFSNASYFIRKFKESYGDTPGVYM